MKDSGEPPSVIHLSDRRPTPREQPAFPGEPPPPAKAPTQVESVRTTLDPLRAVEIGQSMVLERLIPLALPELARFHFPPLFERLRTPGGLTEAELRALETKLGTYPRWVRQTSWLHAPGYPLAEHPEDRGPDNARPGAVGVTQRRGLYLLPTGELGYVEGVELWKTRAPRVFDRALTPTGARRISAQDAVRLFSPHSLLLGLHSLLWFEQDKALQPPAPDLEARRARFLAIIQSLSQFTADHGKQVWRLGLDIE